MKTNPERDGHSRQELHFHQHRADSRRRRLVGGDDGRAASRVPGLEGQPLDSGNWQSHRRQGGASQRALHRAAASQCPSIDPVWEDPTGVPISAMVFGGRRATTTPLVYQAFNWDVRRLRYATMGSKPQPPPPEPPAKFAATPWRCCLFCGYHMGDYFRHWIKMQRSFSVTPRVFPVNWFRKKTPTEFSMARDSAKTCAS